jgi:hypothetical protein
MRIERMCKPLLLALAGLALTAPAVAQAEPINQFSFQVKDIKPGGRFTLLFNARYFDALGGIPPTPTQNYLRLPKGATLRKEFRNKRFFCNGTALRDAINAYDFTGVPFTKRIGNLKPFIRQLERSRDKREHKQAANARTCDAVRIGYGTVRIDARESFPTITDPVRGTFVVFFARPTEPGAIGGFTVLGAADEDQPIVKRRSFEVITGVHAVFNANFFDDPTPDGLYGYRLDLPRGEVNGFKVSIAELNATTTGLSLLRGTCLKRNARGRCVKRQRRTIFWFTTPPCPSSGLLSIEEFYGFDPPQPAIDRTIQLACPRFIQ